MQNANPEIPQEVEAVVGNAFKPRVDFEEVAKKVFLADANGIAAKFDEGLMSVAESFQEVGLGFKSNVVSAVETMMLPFQLVMGLTISGRFKRIEAVANATAARDGKSAEEVRQMIRDSVLDKANPDRRQETYDEVLTELDSMAKDESLTHALEELARQGIVLVWGAFEVLARDVFVTLLNLRPDIAKEIAANDQTKKMFQISKISFDTIADHGFDLSNQMGDFLLGLHPVDTVPAMKAIFPVLFKGRAEVVQSLSSKSLLFLAQKRHLIVHRRGIIDREYLDKTSDSTLLGSKLKVSVQELLQMVWEVQSTGLVLLRAASSAL